MNKPFFLGSFMLPFWYAGLPWGSRKAETCLALSGLNTYGGARDMSPVLTGGLKTTFYKLL